MLPQCCPGTPTTLTKYHTWAGHTCLQIDTRLTAAHRLLLPQVVAD